MLQIDEKKIFLLYNIFTRIFNQKKNNNVNNFNNYHKIKLMKKIQIFKVLCS